MTSSHTLACTFSKSEVQQFYAHVHAGRYEGQRLGQAFYNHFQLQKMSQLGLLHGLYEADGAAARKLIEMHTDQGQ